MSENIGKGFNLVMELESPERLPELMIKLADPLVKPNIQRSLAALDYVHFARFLPLWEQGLLLIVTEFDGEMKDYVMDFAAVLDSEFSLILSYMKGYDKKHLPVSRHPDAFWAYVDRNTGPKIFDPSHPFPPPYEEPFCAYPGLTTLDIGGVARGKNLPEAPQREAEPDVARDDVQAHVLKSYRAASACHLGFEFVNAEQGRRMLSDLAQRVTNESDARQGKFCITLGLTHAGLQALGLPQDMLDRFPTAYREGPRLRSARLGDSGHSDPRHWSVAGFEAGQPVVVHGMVSVYSSVDRRALNTQLGHVRELMAGRAHERFARDADAIGGRGEIHFGYRDGVGQPRFIEGDEADAAAGAMAAGAGTKTLTPAGDLLLGARYRNSRGGYYIGELPEALATHATYAALRIIEQEVGAFEQWLDEVAQRHQLDRELVAAKLVGRWRNGAPLTVNPEQPDPEAAEKPAQALDNFDYAGPSAAFDDREGRRCPIGAHIRRLNPRSGMVLGVPRGRRIVRRGMPYGPKFDAAHPTDDERGLVGLFLCGDLESQFEFIQHAWANEDLSAPGLRHTQDPFSSARELGTPFRFRPKESEAELTVMVPPLTRTRGSVYLFMPGMKGLQWLAQAGWNADNPD